MLYPAAVILTSPARLQSALTPCALRGRNPRRYRARGAQAGGARGQHRLLPLFSIFLPPASRFLPLSCLLSPHRPLCCQGRGAPPPSPPSAALGSPLFRALCPKSRPAPSLPVQLGGSPTQPVGCLFYFILFFSGE